MKSTRNALLAITLCIGLMPLLGAEETKNKPVIYRLAWNSDNVSGTIQVNGFGIAALDGQSGSGSATLNVWLTGSNELKAEIKKADLTRPSGFTIGLSRLSPDETAETGGKGSIFSVEKKDKDFVKAKPVKVTQKFKTEMNFSAHLVKSQRCGEKDVIAYAQKIYGLFEQKDSVCLVKEFSVKLEDYTAAFPGKNAAEEFKTFLDSKFLKGRLVKIDATKLRAIKEGPKGNLWHVVDERGELVKITSPAAGRIEIPVHIGRINGEMKVVR